MTDNASWAGPGVVRVDVTAAGLPTARTAARIATLWQSTGGERGQLAEEGPARTCTPTSRTGPRLAGRPPHRARTTYRPRVRMNIAHRYRSVI